MTAVMIGIDPHKGWHMAVALDASEGFVDELRVRSASNRVERLVAWAAPFDGRTWAIEGAGGLGYLLAQQLVATGECVAAKGMSEDTLRDDSERRRETFVP